MSLVGLFQDYQPLLVGHAHRHATFRQLADEFKRPLDPHDCQFIQFENTALYSPIPYLPALLGVWLARALSWPAIALMYSARMSTAVAYAGLSALAVRAMPILKWACCIVLCGPMAIFLAGGVSADPITIGTGFLATALTLRLALGRNKPPVAFSLCLAACVVALSLCKTLYTPLALFVLVIPLRGANRPAAFLWPAAILVLALLSAAAWSAVAKTMDAGTGPQSNPTQQLHFVYHHPAQFLLIVGRSFWDGKRILLYEMVGRFGWNDTFLPGFVALLYWPVLLWLVLADDGPADLPLYVRWAAVLVSLTTIFVIALGQYLIWNRVGNRHSDGLQGRYFLPVMAMILTAVRRRSARPLPPRTVTLLIIGFLMVAFTTIARRFY